MTRLTFLRHAESIFNSTGIDNNDCELSEVGKQQAITLQLPPDERHFTLGIASPLL
jgi:broad specificity phosphatase PhoE